MAVGRTLLEGLRPQHVSFQPFGMVCGKSPKLSIIVPTYNEERTVADLVHRVNNVRFPIPYEIIMVNDGSRDNTLAIEKKLAKEDPKHIKLLNCRVNQGKGSAIRVGLEHAKGDLVVIQDADLEYYPEEIPKLLIPILSGEADVVYGSRFKGKDRPDNMGLAFWLANRTLALTANILYGMSITDEATCYKVLRSDVMKAMKLTCKRFEFCPEVTAKAAKMQVRLAELPISYRARSREEGKKIGWKDAFEAFWTLFKFRFVN